MSERVPHGEHPDPSPQDTTRELYDAVGRAWQDADLAPATLTPEQSEAFACAAHDAILTFLDDKFSGQIRLIPNTRERTTNLLHAYYATFRAASHDSILEQQRRAHVAEHAMIAIGHAQQFPQVAYVLNMATIFRKHEQPAPADALHELLAVYGVLLKPIRQTPATPWRRR